ncbi:MAG: pantoate--beta-alanine ligase [Vicinamibacterales bacterium]
MRRVRTVAELRTAVKAPRRAGRVGFVPTMGALHEGHAALMALARAECEHVVASIFVNPAQFNDPADLAAYPRPDDRDAQIAADAGVDVLFVPDSDEVYRPDHATAVHVAGPAEGLEGRSRSGHFDGVALVCLKLFAMVQPDVAYFGQKDAQQVAVIRQLVRDLNLPLDVRVVPTVRDHDGLALSSRNARLSAEERAMALAVPRALLAGLEAHRRGADAAVAARQALDGVALEYAAVVDFNGQPTLLVAAVVGRTRLIDNVPLEHPELAGFSDRAMSEDL